VNESSKVTVFSHQSTSSSKFARSQVAMGHKSRPRNGPCVYVPMSRMTCRCVNFTSLPLAYLAAAIFAFPGQTNTMKGLGAFLSQLGCFRRATGSDEKMVSTRSALSTFSMAAPVLFSLKPVYSSPEEGSYATYQGIYDLTALQYSRLSNTPGPVSNLEIARGRRLWDILKDPRRNSSRKEQ
jgi:hypothetical protein